ncbi:hypothetical protein K458DRAFT_435685 [Lentithecium fluviatile CBS 122367]|uniref:Uncharacterized protein n=1 Tax=Lentithecium fluviatile CBS 122367 TaxID=1168545 RepID=A0A6G1IL68_9PLEO|nr:hypothetical protein K458DRAFT_435685 [Lentithecium fluviatile CBS 122367]
MIVGWAWTERGGVFCSTTWPSGSQRRSFSNPMTSISGIVAHVLVREKRGFMRELHRHQHYAAAIADSTLTWSSAGVCISDILSYRLLPLGGAQGYSSELSERIRIKRGNLRLLKPLFLRIPRTTKTPLKQRQQPQRCCLPKPTSLRKLSKKVPPNEDKYAGIGDILGSRPGSNTGRRDKEDPGLTPHGVKVIDLTCFVGEGVYFSPMYGHSILGFEHYVSREVTSDESLSQPAPSEDGSQENAVVIEGGQPELGTDDDDCLLKDDMGMQIGDQLEDSSICPNATEDAIHSEAPAQEASGHTLLEARTYQPQRPVHKKADGQGSSNGSDDDSGNYKKLTRKRKRSPAAKRYSRTSNKTSVAWNSARTGDQNNYAPSGLEA